jgi:hypothetical protein
MPVQGEPKKETAKLVFPPTHPSSSGIGESTIHPRVTFSSYTWKSATPKLENTMSTTDAGSTGSVSLFVPANYNESFGAKWGYEDVVTALIDPKNKAAWGASAVETIDKLTKGPLGGITSAAKFGRGETSFPGEFLLFEKGEPITLDFTFDLLPMNGPEANKIVEIVSYFKRRILPTYGGNDNFFLQFPDIWRIDVKGLNGTGFPATPGIFGDMALTTCKVGYSGGANTVLAFADGNAVMTTLTLQFKSVKNSYIYTG